jgi:hypothetical protein
MSTRKSAERAHRPPYHQARIAVGTRHGKQHQLAPAFREVLDARLITPPGLDTDRFGTFTGERPRPGAALDAARGKARLAMEATGLPLGLASEASYGPLGGLGWTGHEEILLFCDDTLGIEVLEGYRTVSVPGSSARVAGYDDVPRGLVSELPHQALIVRPSGEPPDPDRMVKGITDAGALPAAIAAAAELSAEHLAVVEPDLRAHHNPSRQQVLIRLAASLARRLATRCPRCTTPGFGRAGTEAGLPCRICATPTPLPRSEIHSCPACPHRIERPVPAAWADPAVCPECNP